MSARPVLSPEIANNFIKLYRECLRRASTFRDPYNEYLTIVTQNLFRERMHETDPTKIQEFKNIAIKAVEDHMEYQVEAKARKAQLAAEAASAAASAEATSPAASAEATSAASAES